MLVYGGNKIIISPNKKWLAISADVGEESSLLDSGKNPKNGRIYLWDLSTLSLRHIFKGELARPLSLIFSNDSRQIIAGDMTGFVYVWDVHSYQKLQSIDTDDHRWVRAIAISANGHDIAIGTQDGKLHLYDLLNKKFKWHFNAHEYGVSSLIFLPKNDRLISAGEDQHIYLWESRGPKLLREYQHNHLTHKAHRGMIETLYLIDDHQFASGAFWEGGSFNSYEGRYARDPAVRIWDTKKSLPIKSIKLPYGIAMLGHHSQYLLGLNISGWALAEPFLQVVDIDNNQLLKTYNKNRFKGSYIQSFAVVPNTSDAIVDIGFGEFVIWDFVKDQIKTRFFVNDHRWVKFQHNNHQGKI